MKSKYFFIKKKKEKVCLSPRGSFVIQDIKLSISIKVWNILKISIFLNSYLCHDFINFKEKKNYFQLAKRFFLIRKDYTKKIRG